MSSFLNHFSIFRDFPQEFKRNIKLYHIFDDTGYCVTIDDKVYGFGKSIHYYLGYNESNDNKSYVLIQELCDKSIEQFFGFRGVFFARNESNEIYCWGGNRHGQLGRGFNSNEILKPDKNVILSQMNIIRISCGGKHCLALISDGKVYGWGDNGFKFSESKSFKEKISLTPIVLIQLRQSIKSIHSSVRESFALTFSGKVFCYKREKYMDWEIPGQLIIDLFHKNEVYCQTNESIYERKFGKWKKIDYKNLFEYFVIRYQITYKTIHFINNEMFSIDFYLSQESNEMKKRLEIIDFNESKLTISSSVFRDIPKTLKSDVKCFYKSEDFEFHVTNDNKVYVLGTDKFGKIGLGDARGCNVMTEIIELDDKDIDEFFEGYNCVFARSETNEIFSWGWNEHGQLALGFKSAKRLKPNKIDFFTDKNIIQISCGTAYYLALSSNGTVFEWGLNYEGLVGKGKNKEENVLVPKVIKISMPIKFIDCSDDISFAVDIEGSGYYWGLTSKEIVSRPKKLCIDHVKKIQKHPCTVSNECILLKECGKVVFFNFVENIEIIVGLKVNDIFNDLCETEDCVQRIDFDKGVMNKTNFINFYDYFSSKYKKFCNTIHVKTEDIDGQGFKYLTIKEIQLNPEYNRQTNVENVLVLNDRNVFDRKFQKSFNMIKKIGEGSFGEVFMANERTTQDLVAIKRIRIQGKFLNELNKYLINI